MGKLVITRLTFMFLLATVMVLWSANEHRDEDITSVEPLDEEVTVQHIILEDEEDAPQGSRSSTSKLSPNETEDIIDLPDIQQDSDTTESNSIVETYIQIQELNETLEKRREAEEPEELPYSQETKPVETPKQEPPPEQHGDTSGASWIGQHTLISKYAGWGWVKKENESWKSAKWVMLEETPGEAMAPHRFHKSLQDDANARYRLYGYFADYQGYEPNMDVLVPVFVLKGWEYIGEHRMINRDPPRAEGSHKKRFAERGPNIRFRKLRGR